MSLFEDLKPTLDAQVDSGLGDSITYKINGVAVEASPGVTILNAFLLNFADDGGPIAGIQPLADRWQLKIRKTLLPSRPSLKHIVTAAKLNGPYRPANNNADDDGAYWIVDLQKAPA